MLPYTWNKHDFWRRGTAEGSPEVPQANEVDYDVNQISKSSWDSEVKNPSVHKMPKNTQTSPSHPSRRLWLGSSVIDGRS